MKSAFGLQALCKTNVGFRLVESRPSLTATSAQNVRLVVALSERCGSLGCCGC